MWHAKFPSENTALGWFCPGIRTLRAFIYTCNPAAHTMKFYSTQKKSVKIPSGEVLKVADFRLPDSHLSDEAEMQVSCSRIPLSEAKQPQDASLRKQYLHLKSLISDCSLATHEVAINILPAPMWSRNHQILPFRSRWKQICAFESMINVLKAM